jgi:hypothetical protein
MPAAAASLLSKIKGRKRAQAPTDWHEWPEWRRTEAQAETIRAQAAQAIADHAVARDTVADLRAAVEQAEVSALLGDVAPDAADGVRGQLHAAEQGLVEAARRADRLTAAARAMDGRLERLAQELEQRFRELWLLAYRDELADAARATRAVAAAHERLNQLWARGAGVAADAETPGPLPHFLQDAPGSAIGSWLAAVRAFGAEGQEGQQ